jgi:hypothetical protein
VVRQEEKRVRQNIIHRAVRNPELAVCNVIWVVFGAALVDVSEVVAK